MHTKSVLAQDAPQAAQSPQRSLNGRLFRNKRLTRNGCTASILFPEKETLLAYGICTTGLTSILI
jgi:hypothetical protein